MHGIIHSPVSAVGSFDPAGMKIIIMSKTQIDS